MRRAKLLALLLLCALPMQAAISFRAAANGNGASVSLPAGTAAGDVTIIVATKANHSANDWVLPAGWTAIYQTAAGVAAYRAYQAGDPASVAITAPTGNWEVMGAVSYSGVDTSAPIDAANTFHLDKGGSLNPAIQAIAAPSVRPRFNQEVVVAIYHGPASSANTITLPAGLTPRIATDYGATYSIGEVALTDGTPSPSYTASFSDTNYGVLLAAQVALKPAGASAAPNAVAASPYVAGQLKAAFQFQVADGGTVEVDFSRLEPRDGDILLAYLGGAMAVAAPSGWSLINAPSSSGNLLWHRWSTGEALMIAPTVSNLASPGSATSMTRGLLVIRKNAASSEAVNLDNSGWSLNPGAAPLTATAPAIPVTGANDLVLGVYLSGNSYAGASWTLPTGTAQESYLAGPNLAVVTLAASNPTPAAAASLSGTGIVGLYAYTVAFIVGVPDLPRGQPLGFVAT